MAFWDNASSDQFNEFAEKYGTPFFLYDADEVNDRISFIKNTMKNLVKVFYAVKANPNLELLKAVNGFADGLDISSGGELEQASLAGFNMAGISFAGPAKTVEELTAAIEHGVGSISIESMRELKECIDISKRVRAKTNVVIRVNPQHLNRSFGMKMGGKAIQFGIDEVEVDGIVDAILANPDQLNFQGIHVYAGSQCFEVNGQLESVENTLRIARGIESRTGITCKTINLGGGFGVSHGETSRELDVNALSVKLIPLLRAFHDSSKVEREIIFELGRFLTANAGIYVVRVISGKKSGDKNFVMVDGGLHHHLSAAGTFGTALRSNYALKNLSSPNASKVRCTLAGPSCNPTDLLGLDVELPRPEPGNLIAVEKSGSYGFTASPILFLGRPTPAELVCRKGRVILGRRTRTIVDFN